MLSSFQQRDQWLTDIPEFSVIFHICLVLARRNSTCFQTVILAPDTPWARVVIKFIHKSSGLEEMSPIFWELWSFQTGHQINGTKYMLVTHPDKPYCTVYSYPFNIKVANTLGFNGEPLAMYVLVSRWIRFRYWPLSPSEDFHFSNKNTTNLA